MQNEVCMRPVNVKRKRQWKTAQILGIRLKGDGFSVSSVVLIAASGFPIASPRRWPITQGGSDMSDISLEHISISPRVKQTESEDGAVLLDIEQGICFSLNAVGLKIWEMLKRQSPIEQIADSLAQEFHIPRAEIIADICDFVTQLESKHLIARGTAPVEKRRLWTKLRFLGGNAKQRSDRA
jgi:hypothetical protein